LIDVALTFPPVPCLVLRSFVFIPCSNGRHLPFYTKCPLLPIPIFSHITFFVLKNADVPVFLRVEWTNLPDGGLSSRSRDFLPPVLLFSSLRKSCVLPLPLFNSMSEILDPMPLQLSPFSFLPRFRSSVSEGRRSGPCRLRCPLFGPPHAFCGKDSTSLLGFRGMYSICFPSFLFLSPLVMFYPLLSVG